MAGNDDDKNGKKVGKRRKYGSDKRYPGVRWYDSRIKGRVFYLYYRNPAGRLIERKVGTQHEGWTAKLVHERRLDLIKKFERGEGGKGKKIRTFGDAVDVFFERCQKRGIKGIAQERSRLRWLSHLSDRRFVGVLSELVLTEIVEKMREAGQSSTSIHHALALFRRVVNAALEDKRCPIKELDPYFKKVLSDKIFEFSPDPGGKVERLPMDQVRTFVETLETWPDRFHANIVILALFTGARKGNILKLEWSDIDWDQDKIILRKEKTKAKRRDTPIPMNDMAKKALQEMRTIRDNALERLEMLRQKALEGPPHVRSNAVKEFLLLMRKTPYVVSENWDPETAPETVERILHTPVNKMGSPYVFPGKGGGQRVEIRRGIQKIRAAVGIPPDFRMLHGSRHQFASLLALSGAPAAVIKELLGHSDIRMSERYIDMTYRVKQEASQKVVEQIKGY